MLTNKDKVRVGEEPMEDVEHFAHDRDECDHLGFTGGHQARVEGAQDRVVLGGGDGGHVEDVAHNAASAAHMPGAMTAVAVPGHHDLGNALSALGLNEEARLAMLRSVELDPNSRSAFLDLSNLEINAGRLDQAFYWAKRGFPLAPNMGVSYYHVATPLMLLDEAGAERWLRAGRARLPAGDRTGGHRLDILLGYLELYRGQLPAALERARKLVAARPTNSECQATLTEMAVFAGSVDAVERVEQALKAGPGARPSYSSYTPRTMRAFLWLKAGDRERAQPLIEAALAANRTAIAGGDRGTSPPYENAALHVMRGDHAAALDSLEAARAAGLMDAAFMKADPFLAALSREPRFRRIVGRITRDLREMKSRVDLRELDELLAIGSGPAPPAPPSNGR